ncbi:MAG: enolase C-terminal domain-like protein [Acuticoccus sp.]
MQIRSIEAFPIRLPLKQVLTLARGVSRTLEEGKQIILVKITGEDGTVGWGEAGPSRRWSAETTQSTHSSIVHYLAPVLIGRDAFDIAGAHAAMDKELAPGLDPGQPIAKAAIDLALHDLVAKSLGIPLQAYFGHKTLDRVRLAYLVSAPDPEATAEVVQRGLDAGYRDFKLKVGSDLATDIRNLEVAMSMAGEDGKVWPDANQGYTLAEALRAARAFDEMGVEVFEQPVPMNDTYGMKKLLSATAMTIALDEATMGLPFVIELLRREAIEGVVVKVNKCGGLYYARQLCDLARNAGMVLIGSGLMDAPIGFAASTHLFAGYGISFPVDLNGPQHIAEDYLAEPLPIELPYALVPDAPGHGCVIDEAKVKAFRLDL